MNAKENDKFVPFLSIWKDEFEEMTELTLYFVQRNANEARFKACKTSYHAHIILYLSLC